MAMISSHASTRSLQGAFEKLLLFSNPPTVQFSTHSRQFSAYCLLYPQSSSPSSVSLRHVVFGGEKLSLVICDLSTGEVIDRIVSKDKSFYHEFEGFNEDDDENSSHVSGGKKKIHDGLSDDEDDDRYYDSDYDEEKEKEKEKKDTKDEIDKDHGVGSSADVEEHREESHVATIESRWPHYEHIIPLSSGKFFTVDNTGCVRVWDRETHRCEEFHVHTRYVTVCKLMKESELIVTGSEDKTVNLWSSQTGKLVIGLGKHNDVIVEAEEISCTTVDESDPDGDRDSVSAALNSLNKTKIFRLVTSDGGTIRIWQVTCSPNPAYAAALSATLTNLGGGSFSAAGATSGGSVTTGGSFLAGKSSKHLLSQLKHNAPSFRGSTGNLIPPIIYQAECVKMTTIPHRCMAYVRPVGTGVGKIVISTGQMNNNLQVLDVMSLNKIQDFSGHRDEIKKIIIVPALTDNIADMNQSKILTTSKDNTMRMWNLNSENSDNDCQVLNPMEDDISPFSSSLKDFLHQDNYTNVAFIVSSRLVLYRSDHYFQVWNMSACMQEFCLPFHYPKEQSIASDENLLKFHEIIPLASPTAFSIELLIRNEADQYSLWKYHLPETFYREKVLQALMAQSPIQWDNVRRIVEDAIDMGVNDSLINVVNEEEGKKTLLMYAVEDRQGDLVYNMLRAIKANKASVNAKDANGWSALFYALQTPIIGRIVLALLDHGADATVVDRNGVGLVTYAMQMDKPAKLVKILLSHGANADTVDFANSPIIVRAVETRQSAIVQALLENGAKHDVTNSNEEPILIVAIEQKFTTIVRLLIKFGASTNTINKNGVSALEVAVKCSHEGVVYALLEYGADPNSVTKDGDSMLVVAIEQPTPSFDVIKILLDRGADLNKKTNAGLTPLELAIDKNLPEIVAFLLDRLQNISLDWNKVLERLLSKQDAVLLHIFLTREVPVDAIFTDKEDILWKAVEIGSISGIRYFVEQHSMVVECVQRNGTTTLQFVLSNLESSVMKLSLGALLHNRIGSKMLEKIISVSSQALSIYKLISKREESLLNVIETIKTFSSRNPYKTKEYFIQEIKYILLNSDYFQVWNEYIPLMNCLSLHPSNISSSIDSSSLLSPSFLHSYPVFHQTYTSRPKTNPVSPTSNSRPLTAPANTDRIFIRDVLRVIHNVMNSERKERHSHIHLLLLNDSDSSDNSGGSKYEKVMMSVIEACVAELRKKCEGEVNLDVKGSWYTGVIMVTLIQKDTRVYHFHCHRYSGISGYEWNKLVENGKQANGVYILLTDTQSDGQRVQDEICNCIGVRDSEKIDRVHIVPSTVSEEEIVKILSSIDEREISVCLNINTRDHKISSTGLYCPLLEWQNEMRQYWSTSLSTNKEKIENDSDVMNAVTNILTAYYQYHSSINPSMDRILSLPMTNEIVVIKQPIASVLHAVMIWLWRWLYLSPTLSLILSVREIESVLRADDTNLSSISSIGNYKTRLQFLKCLAKSMLKNVEGSDGVIEALLQSSELLRLVNALSMGIRDSDRSIVLSLAPSMTKMSYEQWLQSVEREREKEQQMIERKNPLLFHKIKRLFQLSPSPSLSSSQETVNRSFYYQIVSYLVNTFSYHYHCDIERGLYCDAVRLSKDVAISIGSYSMYVRVSICLCAIKVIGEEKGSEDYDSEGKRFILQGTATCESGMREARDLLITSLTREIDNVRAFIHNASLYANQCIEYSIGERAGNLVEVKEIEKKLLVEGRREEDLLPLFIGSAGGGENIEVREKDRNTKAQKKGKDANKKGTTVASPVKLLPLSFSLCEFDFSITDTLRTKGEERVSVERETIQLHSLARSCRSYPLLEDVLRVAYSYWQNCDVILSFPSMDVRNWLCRFLHLSQSLSQPALSNLVPTTISSSKRVNLVDFDNAVSRIIAVYEERASMRAWGSGDDVSVMSYLSAPAPSALSPYGTDGAWLRPLTRVTDSRGETRGSTRGESRGESRAGGGRGGKGQSKGKHNLAGVIEEEGNINSDFPFFLSPQMSTVSSLTAAYHDDGSITSYDAGGSVLTYNSSVSRATHSRGPSSSMSHSRSQHPPAITLAPQRRQFLDAGMGKGFRAETANSRVKAHDHSAERTGTGLLPMLVLQSIAPVTISAATAAAILPFSNSSISIASVGSLNSQSSSAPLFPEQMLPIPLSLTSSAHRSETRRQQREAMERLSSSHAKRRAKVIKLDEIDKNKGPMPATIRL